MAANDPVRTIGRYHILEELGRGAMGIVYKGHDPVIGRTVALKTIALTSDADMPDLRERLYREAGAAGKLTHPNIVTVYDVIEEHGTTAVAMEFIEGQTLKDLIDTRAPIPVEASLDLFEQIAAALDYASARKVIHRDIKPANIRVTSDGRAKVADFGLARIGGSSQTNAGLILGTPSYMSPEQACGLELDGRSDLFSAAAVLYEMLTRQKVFAGKDLGDTLERIIKKPTPPAYQFNPAIDHGVSAILDGALAKNPDERYPTGAELIAALRRATETQALPTMEIPDAGDPLARTIVMLPRSATQTATVTATQPLAHSGRAPAARTPGAQRTSPARTADPLLQRADASSLPAEGQGNSRGLMAAIVIAAVVLGGAAIAVVTMLKGQPVRPAATEKAAADPKPASGAGAQPAAPDDRTPAQTAPPPSPSRGSLPSRARGSQRVGAPEEPVPERSRPASSSAATATLLLAFEGAPYSLTLVANGKTIGRVSDGQTSVTVDPGNLQLRAVNEQLYLDQDLGAVSLAAGERRTISIPGTAAAVIGVRGENYSGLRILLDGKPLASPYPAQLPRIAASAHKIEFRWTDGVLQGVTIADTIDLSNGRQFIVRAVPEGAQVTVQKVR